jgi:DNA-binding Lrp family transcriptional regulator
VAPRFDERSVTEGQRRATTLAAGHKTLLSSPQEPLMADHSLFVFVRVQGATPESVGNALRDAIGEIMDIYSIMGEWDLLVRIEHPDLNTIQKVVTESIRANPNVAQTYTILGYQLYGSKWPGFDFPDEE